MIVYCYSSYNFYYGKPHQCYYATLYYSNNYYRYNHIIITYYCIVILLHPGLQLNNHNYTTCTYATQNLFLLFFQVTQVNGSREKCPLLHSFDSLFIRAATTFCYIYITCTVHITTICSLPSFLQPLTVQANQFGFPFVSFSLCVAEQLAYFPPHTLPS